MSHHEVFILGMPTSTGTVGPDNKAKTPAWYYGGVVEMASGSVIITDDSGTVIDQIVATATSAGKTWLGPNGVKCLMPLHVAVTGTVAGSIYYR